MTILGISCYYHDAAAALITDGVIVAAAEEERFSRKKHDSDFPSNAIDFVLTQGGIDVSEVDYVVFYEKPFKKFHRILTSTFSNYPKSIRVFQESMRSWLTYKLWIKQHITTHLNIKSDKILFSDHHLSHAASCFYPSPFKHSAILTVDGAGEWTTASYGVGKKNKIKLIKELHYPNSVGLLYSAFTAFLGYKVNGGEGKVMGLAPYGKPKYVEDVYRVVKQHKDSSIELDLSYFDFQFSITRTYSDKFLDLFGTPTPPNQAHIVTEHNADIASSIQHVLEEIVIKMAIYVRKKTKQKNLCMAGGVFLNSVANERILKKSGFKKIFIQPAAGDSGGALGAALYAYHHVLNNSNRAQMTHAYLGKSYDNDEIKTYLDFVGVKYRKLSRNVLVKKTAKAIEKGKIIGWMQGRFEYGPRALGNRSIMADPRQYWMKDVLNARVKFREGFRPFAPSALIEHGSKVFDTPSDVVSHHPLRYMLYVVDVKKSWREKVPAINHVDNTARPQFVVKDTNPLYHEVINTFYKSTGVPLIVNTSFNLRGEPIVNTPENAYNTFNKSGIDILAMGNYWVEKESSMR